MLALEGMHPLGVEDYLRLAISPDWDQTDLIDGVIYDVSPEYDLHAKTAAAVYQALVAVFPADEVRFAGSVKLGPTTLVQPDVFVIDGRADFDPLAALDGSLIKLAVEVSVTTLRRDLGVKLTAYAKAQVPEYWVVAPGPACYLLRHTGPTDGRYTAVQRVDLPGEIVPTHIAQLFET